MHACYNYCFLEKENQDANTVLLSIPLLAPIANKEEKISLKIGGETNYVGQGSIFIYLKLKDKDKLKKSQTLNLIGAIANIGKDLTYNYLLEVGLKQAKELGNQTEILQKHAMRSAFASIISRNGSHNLGSHILSSLQNGYQDLPDLHNLINYIQERFDYLALVTTNFPEWTYPVYLINDLISSFFEAKIIIELYCRNRKYWCL